MPDGHEDGIFPEEVIYEVCKCLELRDLLAICTTSQCMLQIVNSIVRQRFLRLIGSPHGLHRAKTRGLDPTTLYFESSSPSDPSKHLQAPLLFRTFANFNAERVTPSRITAQFSFEAAEETDRSATEFVKPHCHPSPSFRFQMDESQSFQTFLLSVRLRGSGCRFRRGVYRADVELAEGLERVWKAWFEDDIPALEEGESRTVKREQPLDRAVSMRSLSIEQTIACANLLVYPQAKRRPVGLLPEPTYSRPPVSYEMAWASCDLNVARVMCNIEATEKRHEGEMILFFPSSNAPNVPVQRFRPRFAT